MNKPAIYEIRVEGHLGERWLDWFEGLSIRVMKRSYGERPSTNLPCSACFTYPRIESDVPDTEAGG